MDTLFLQSLGYIYFLGKFSRLFQNFPEILIEYQSD